MSVTDQDAVDVDAVEQALEARLRDQGRFVVLGRGDLPSTLLGRYPDLFQSRDSVSGPAFILAVGLDEETLAEARATAQELAVHIVVVAVDSSTTGAPISLPAVRERVRPAGLALAGLERLLWWQRPGGLGDTRLERIDGETRLALARCVVADDPRAVAELEETLSRLQRDLDLQQQLDVEHARTREAERVRAERLREVEAVVDRLGGADLAEEVGRLRAEIESMQATRLWRFGARWWTLKERLRRNGE